MAANVTNDTFWVPGYGPPNPLVGHPHKQKRKKGHKIRLHKAHHKNPLISHAKHPAAQPRQSRYKPGRATPIANPNPYRNPRRSA